MQKTNESTKGAAPRTEDLLESVQERGGFSGLREELLSRIRKRDLVRFEVVEFETHSNRPKKSPLYAYVKSLYGEQDGLNLVSDCIVALLLEKGVVSEDDLENHRVCVAGKGYGSASPISALTSRWGIPHILVSDKASKHNGKKGGIFTAHEPKEGDRIIIVDDTFDSGGGLREVIEKLAGFKVLCCIVVQKRGYGNIGDSGVPLYHLFESDELNSASSSDPDVMKLAARGFVHKD